MKVEYKVRPVTRYVVTEWIDFEVPGTGSQPGSKVICELDNFGLANKTCAALAYDTDNNKYVEFGEQKTYYTLYSPDYPLDDIKVLVGSESCGTV